MTRLHTITGHSLDQQKRRGWWAPTAACSCAQIASAYGLRDSRAGTENRRGSKRKNAHYESGHSSENPVLEGNIVVGDRAGGCCRRSGRGTGRNVGGTALDSACVFGRTAK